MQLEDWLDDLCVRFIINLPPEELESVERICFQVEEAQWYYEDFIRPITGLPPLPLRAFSLRIFQHCPLFSQWSSQHHATAFAEFLAYKQRVPVRGAIMLNEAMDEVVLVRGFKSGANWSFPRGKINKDEPDLDCAIREVYEETGFDLRAAGLVKDEQEMKAIDVTMREQNMKLFIFRGVPKDAYFEPRTRKEIGKIAWYKLTDLPAQKKHKQQDGNYGAVPMINANKFYMVAPFLTQLKKWIAQQKKKENRHSSHLAAPPIMAEDSEVDNVPVKSLESRPVMPSDLPEVTVTKMKDPTAHLKDLFNIGSPPPQQLGNPLLNPARMPAADTAKSNALLALLRGGPTAELRAGPSTPLEQISFPAGVPRSPQHSQLREPPSTALPPPPQFNTQSELYTSPPAATPVQPAHPPPSRPQGQTAPPFEPPCFSLPQSRAPQSFAPHQQPGDPQFGRPQPPGIHGQTAPPASALPKLTGHTKALLDVFKGSSLPAPPAQAGPFPGQTQSLLNIFKSSTPTPSAPPPSRVSPQIDSHQGRTQSQIQSPKRENELVWPNNESTIHRLKGAHQSNLLNLFAQQGHSTSTAPAPALAPIGRPIKAPAELAATIPMNEPAKPSKDEALLALLRKPNSVVAGPSNMKHRSGSTFKEGETSATISGPLNQPNFEAIPRTPKETVNGMGRTPLTTHRTLFDPKQPATMKILARPEEQRQPSKSPRPARAKVASSSPRRHAKPAQKEPPKPFQPQILRRPQTSRPQTPESVSVPPAEAITTSQAVNDRAVLANSSPISRNTSSEQEKLQPQRMASQADAHKQTLLSLFGGSPTGASGVGQVQTPSRVVSPLSSSQIVSPENDVPVSAIEPISTRSRMGSLASIGGSAAPARPVLDKRQTGAENKAFLLSYLGRIATQEG